MVRTDFIFLLRKQQFEANTMEEFMKRARVDVVDPRQRRIILRAITIEDMRRKLGG